MQQVDNINKFLHDIAGRKTRNIIRGMLADGHVGLNSKNINKIKKIANLSDLSIISKILFSKNGIRSELNLPNEFISLCRNHNLRKFTLSKEFVFNYSYLNTRQIEITALLEDIETLNTSLKKLNYSSLLEIEHFYERWGISSFLMKKFCFIVKNAPIDNEFIEKYKHLTNLFRVSDYATPYFQTLDMAGLNEPSFEHVELQLDVQDQSSLIDFRQIFCLHTAVPVPLGAGDIINFIQKHHVCSFVDEVISLKILYDTHYENNYISRLFDKFIAPTILILFGKFDGGYDKIEAFFANLEKYDDNSHYVSSSIFCEYRSCSNFRKRVDYAILHRLFPNECRLEFCDFFLTGKPDKDKKSLSHKLVGFNPKIKSVDASNDGTLLRTARYMCFLHNWPHQLDFSDTEIKKIFGCTISLHQLMTVEEIDRLHALSEIEGRHIISTLSLAIKREKNFNDDVDYTFRRNLEKAIIKYFKSDLLIFIGWLNQSVPDVAKFLVNILSRVTIEKLYQVISGSNDADITRQNILNLMAEQTGEIKYLIAADKIKVDNKIKSIRRHIERSRVYIDEYSFRKWVHENSIKKIGDYHRFTQNYFETIKANGIIIDSPDSFDKIKEFHVLYDFDHLIEETLIEAYQVFCTNRHFGLDSYIGRRIRHNTIRGVMQSPVDNVLTDSKHRHLYQGSTFSQNCKLWKAFYKKQIDDLATEKLYFRSTSKPLGMFISDASNMSATLEAGIRQIKFGLSHNVPYEDLSTDIIEFCWNSIQPQLQNVEKNLKIDTLALANSRIDELFGVDESTPQRFVNDLKASVANGLSKVGNWFKVPDNKIERATINEIVQLVYDECKTNSPQFICPMNLFGDKRDIPLVGSSVHYLYDCLDVVLFNIAENAPSNSNFSLKFDLAHSKGSNITDLKVSVLSKLKAGQEGDEDYKKLETQFEDDEELSIAMVKEGLSGIRKLRFLTEKLNREQFTLFERNGNDIEIKFTIPVIIPDGTYEHSFS